MDINLYTQEWKKVAKVYLQATFHIITEQKKISTAVKMIKNVSGVIKRLKVFCILFIIFLVFFSKFFINANINYYLDS